jgi:hypothetical protein
MRLKGLVMKFNERKFGIWLAVALALFYIVFVIGVMGANDSDNEGSQIPFVVGGILSGIVILAGLRYERSNLRVGGIITIVGALPLGLLMFWLVIPGLIAIVVAALTVRRTFTSRIAEA